MAQAGRITDDACIGCLDCTAVCPVKGTLAVRPPRLSAVGALRGVAVGARKYAYVVGMLAAFFAVIIAAQAGGYWIDKQGVTASGDIVVISNAQDIDEIKGWMKMSDVSSAYGFSLPELYQHFNIPPDTSPELTFNDVKPIVKGFSADEVKIWLKAGQTRK